MSEDRLDPHYFWQDLYVARRIFHANPDRHVDVGSRVDGFLTHLLSFRSEVEHVDIRRLAIEIPGLTVRQADARTMRGFADGSVPSLSSLHVVEHIGLGRYGDDLDEHGWRAALRTFARVLAPRGVLYVSVPVGGEERTVGDLHRIFRPATIVAALPELSLQAFSLVGDDGCFHGGGATFEAAERCRYGCGIFEFRKDANGSI